MIRSKSKANTEFAKFLGKIGRCGFCMRQALGAAIVAWLAYYGVEWLQLSPTAAAMAALVAASLTLLWLVHVAVYAARAFGEVPAASGANISNRGQERRQAVRLLARGAAAAVLLSTPIVLWSSRASAFCGQCTQQQDCGTCRCVNTAPVNSGKICNECICP